VENGGEPWRATEVFGVTGEGVERAAHGGEQGVVEPSLVLVGEAAQLLRQGEGEHEPSGGGSRETDSR
jgi:hypothetical protein